METVSGSGRPGECSLRKVTQSRLGVGAVTLASDPEAGTGGAGKARVVGPQSHCAFCSPLGRHFDLSLLLHLQANWEWEGGVKSKRTPACHILCT